MGHVVCASTRGNKPVIKSPETASYYSVPSPHPGLALPYPFFYLQRKPSDVSSSKCSHLLLDPTQSEPPFMLSGGPATAGWGLASTPGAWARCQPQITNPPFLSSCRWTDDRDTGGRAITPLYGSITQYVTLSLLIQGRVLHAFRTSPLR